MSLGPHAHQICMPPISFFGFTSKQKIYVRKPRTVDGLKVSIREEIATVPQEIATVPQEIATVPQEIATVPQEMLVNVIQNFEERLRTRVRQEGRHLSDIIFRK